MRGVILFFKGGGGKLRQILFFVRLPLCRAITPCSSKQKNPIESAETGVLKTILTLRAAPPYWNIIVNKTVVVAPLLLVVTINTFLC